MAYKRVPHGYEVTNPYGELLLYHDTDITINAGVIFDHDDIEGINGQTVFSLTLPTGSVLLENTLVARFLGVTYSQVISSGDVTVDSSDPLGHTISIQYIPSVDTNSPNPRANGARMVIGGHTLRFASWTLSSPGLLSIVFENQSQRAREFQAIQDELSSGDQAFEIRFLPSEAVVDSVADASTTTPDVTLTLPSYEGESVSFDFEEMVTTTHEVANSAGGAQIPLVLGDELEFSETTGSYVIVEDQPSKRRGDYYIS